MSVISDFVTELTPVLTSVGESLAAIKTANDSLDLKLDEIKVKLDNQSGISQADKDALSALVASAKTLNTAGTDASLEAAKVLAEGTELAADAIVTPPTP